LPSTRVVYCLKLSAKPLSCLFRVFGAIRTGGEPVNFYLYIPYSEFNFTQVFFEGVKNMAFIDIDSVEPGGPTFYNLGEAVGYGGKNMIEDVKVVQFFLQRFYAAVKGVKKPFGEMVPDGKCGPITRGWITRFQIDVRQKGADCSVDGLIDKASNSADNRHGSISHTEYAIRVLNNALRKEDADVYKNLTTHPAVPADLKLVFLQIQAEGPPMSFGKAAAG
jgi:hypothetical protein